MSFSVNTNVASLQAQDYIRQTSDFQAKTINRVTSGLRIVQSGDDAAGLAIANGLRSDQAVLTQGIRNANDGLSQLQIIDGGMNNISKLLDRARTLATQSASGTFTGDRSVLNSEYQSVMTEIDRQAQSIGLTGGGDFAKNLSVFIGGGRAGTSNTAIDNGSVSVDLSQSTVDTKGLGLKGVQASGGTLDISAGQNTSVQKIVADTNNTTATKGYTEFDFSGAGFSGANRIKVAVNLSSVTDPATLATALNSAIQTAGAGSTSAATAFKNANITAYVATDSNGQHIAFSSSNSAFQVQAGDMMSNALLGNTTSATSTTSKALTTTVTGANNALAAGNFSAGQNVIIRFQGGGLASPKDITLNLTGADNAASAITALSTKMSQDADLQAAGIKLGNSATGAPLTFTDSRGEAFSVQAAGDTGNLLGLGSGRLATAGGTSFEYSSVSSATALAAGATTLQVSVGGGNYISGSIDLTASHTSADAQKALNDFFNSNATLKAAGMNATVTAGALTITSTNGTAFRLNVTGADAAGLALGSAGTDLTGATGTTGGTTSTAELVDASGSSAFSAAEAFKGIVNGDDKQTLTISSPNANGVSQATTFTLDNTNARTLDEAINTINAQIQKTDNPVLQKIVAVKENVSGTEKINFLSTNTAFSVSLGKTTNDVGIGTGGDEGSTLNASAQGTAATSDISNQTTAQSAVTSLSKAVSALGKAQAVVGKGQNQFNYAVNLAQSQLSNMAASESRIRDADLASEAANLTKAQITLQAGIAALAQANSAPQAVLSLLRG